MAIREESTSVLVVGAGPVGLSLAQALHRCGVETHVVEKNPSTSEHSRAPAIWPRTLEIFKAIGVIDEILSEGLDVERLCAWWVDKNRPLIEAPFNELRDITEFAKLHVLAQNRTEALLVEKLKESTLVDVRFSHELITYEAHKDHIMATVKSNEETYRIQARFMIGCDGAHSTVRDILGWHLKGETYPAQASLVDVKIPALKEQDWPWPRFSLKDEISVAIRLDPELWRLILPSKETTTDLKEPSDKFIARKVRHLFGNFEHEVIWRSSFRLHCRTAPSFRNGRVLLAGDAAHLNSPVGGQGMNSGIQDAHNLAWKLAYALEENFSWRRLLDSFEEERRQVVMQNVDKFTDFATRMILLRGSTIRALFYYAVKTALRIPLSRRQILLRATMLDHRYKASFLFPEEDDREGQLIGHHTLRDRDGNPQSIQDLIFPQSALLLFEKGRFRSQWQKESILSQLPESLKKRLHVYHVIPGRPTENDQLKDRNRRFFKRLKLKEATAVLVRPDGFIGAVIPFNAANGTKELILQVQLALGYSHQTQ